MSWASGNLDGGVKTRARKTAKSSSPTPIKRRSSTILPLNPIPLWPRLPMGFSKSRLRSSTLFPQENPVGIARTASRKSTRGGHGNGRRLRGARIPQAGAARRRIGHQDKPQNKAETGRGRILSSGPARSLANPHRNRIRCPGKIQIPDARSQLSIGAMPTFPPGVVQKAGFLGLGPYSSPIWPSSPVDCFPTIRQPRPSAALGPPISRLRSNRR